MNIEAATRTNDEDRRTRELAAATLAAGMLSAVPMPLNFTDAAKQAGDVYRAVLKNISEGRPGGAQSNPQPRVR